MSTLQLEKLNLMYPDGTHAVIDVDLDVADGEFCVFLGPSGCGKTSTLRMIAGLEQPTDGEIRIDGAVINDLYPGERDIAMVFQHYALYPNKTVRAHFEMPLEAQNVPKQERAQRVQEIAELLRMTDLLDTKPRHLSGGQAQRTAIGRALIRKPKLFLLDEPLTSLDATLRLETRSALKRLQEDLGITTVYVTHDQEEALSLADRIMVMNEGTIQQLADPEALYSSPENLFVAGFIGTPPMNVIAGTVRTDRDEPYVESYAFDIPLANEGAGLPDSVGDGTEVVVGVRPEDLDLAPHQDRHPGGKVMVTELQGDEWIVSIEVDDATDDNSSGIWKIRAPRIIGQPRLTPGEHVGLSIRPGGFRLFDRATSARIG